VVRRSADEVVKQYQDLKRSAPRDYDFAERHLNDLGYMLLSRGRTADAIAIFKLNVAEYPSSGNTYDSLAEAYEKSGDTHLAIENYRKAVDLDPKNQNARDRLKALQGS